MNARNSENSFIGVDDDGPLWAMISSFQEKEKGRKIFEYPLLRSLFFNINQFVVVDAQFARELFTKSS